MTYPPPPPPPSQELIDHQAAQLAWAQKHKPHLFPAYVPLLPPPVPVVAPAPIPVACPAPVPVPVAPPKRKINARSKGQRGEREIVDLLQEVVDTTRTRHKLEPIVLQRNTLQAHLGGCDLHGLEGFSVEVKFQEIDYNSAWWAQAVRQAGATKIPILFYRRSRQAWTVKFRAYVNTPKDRDQIEIDITCNEVDFISWFKEALDEACVDEMQRLK